MSITDSRPQSLSLFSPLTIWGLGALELESSKRSLWTDGREGAGKETDGLGLPVSSTPISLSLVWDRGTRGPSPAVLLPLHVVLSLLAASLELLVNRCAGDTPFDLQPQFHMLLFLVNSHLKNLLFSTSCGYEPRFREALSSVSALAKEPGGGAVCWGKSPRVTLLSSHATSRGEGMTSATVQARTSCRGVLR